MFCCLVMYIFGAQSSFFLFFLNALFWYSTDYFFYEKPGNNKGKQEKYCLSAHKGFCEELPINEKLLGSNSMREKRIYHYQMKQNHRLSCKS